MVTLYQALSHADGSGDYEDLLNPARGMIFGLELSAYFWAILFGLSL